jgi:hypothetical protein
MIKNNVVADEMIFTATNEFFDNMSKKDVVKQSKKIIEKATKKTSKVYLFFIKFVIILLIIDDYNNE